MIRLWRVQPVTPDLRSLGDGYRCLTYRGARRLAEELNAARHEHPEAFSLPPFRWLVLRPDARP